VYACICAAVTDVAVGTAICRGARTPEDIGAATGAGTGCGSCHDHLCDMIALLTDRTPAVAAAS
jgi:bacterioferritin-associated ferredoxin